MSSHVEHSVAADYAQQADVSISLLLLLLPHQHRGKADTK